MKLSEAHKADKVKILSIDSPTVLKKRLSSLGLSVGKEVEVVEMTMQKNTIKISVGMGFLALRFDEAKCINVEKIG